MSWIYMARTKCTMAQFVWKDQTSPNQTSALAKTEANWMEIELTCYLYLLSWGTRQCSRLRVAMSVSVQCHSDELEGDIIVFPRSADTICASEPTGRVAGVPSSSRGAQWCSANGFLCNGGYKILQQVSDSCPVLRWLPLLPLPTA